MIRLMRLLHGLSTQHACVISTPYGPDIGLQTVIQLDGDVIVRLIPAVLHQPALWRTHHEQVARVLTSLRRLRQGLAWGTTIVATLGTVPLGVVLWWQTQTPWWLSSAGVALGTFLGHRLLARLLGAYIRHKLQGGLR